MVRIGFLSVLVVAALGCGGGDPCADSRCPNDTRSTPAQYESCVNKHNSDRGKKCYQEGVNYELCVQASRVCTSGGTTDSSATLSRSNNDCKLALDAVLCCALGFASCR